LRSSTLYLSGSYEQASEIGAALCADDPLFLNNGVLATALASGVENSAALFETATKKMEHPPDYIRYNMLAFQKAAEIGVSRVRNVLFFATFPSTIMPGKALRPGVRPLRVEVESPGQRHTARVFEGGFISVGRSPGLDITIKDDGNVSRFHGLFYYRDALYHYRDLGSTLGSFLGAQRVRHETPLVGMEAIRVGQTLLRISY